MLPTKSIRPYYALSEIFVRDAIDAHATSRVSRPAQTGVEWAGRARSAATPCVAVATRRRSTSVARKIALCALRVGPARRNFPAGAANGVTSGSVSI